MSFLESQDLFSFWQACNKRLLPRMCHAVHRFVQDDYLEIPFVALRMFRLRTLSISTSMRSLKPFDLLSLPPTIQELCFNFSVCQSCWIYPAGTREYPADDAEPEIGVISLSKLFPDLHTCKLLGEDHWSYYDLYGWKDSADTKRVNWTDDWKAEWLASLPTSLVHLIVSKLHLKEHNSLQHLTTLQSLEVSTSIYIEGSREWQLPATIEKLKLPPSAGLSPILPAPPGLTELHLRQTGNLSYIAPLIPSTVHSLRLECLANDPLEFTRLPDSLTRLWLLGDCWHEAMAPCLPRSLTELHVQARRFMTWDGLPENLQCFHCGPTTPPNARPRTLHSEAQLNALPRGLRTLWLNTAHAIPATTSWIPPRLEELTIASKAELSDAWLIQVPASMRFLRVDTVVCNLRRLIQVSPEIQTLHIPGSFSALLKSHLPPGLDLIVNDWKVEMVDLDSKILPASLTSLTIATGVSSLSSEFFNNLPQSLTTLEYMNELRGCKLMMNDLAQLPRQLATLRIDNIGLPALKDSHSSQKSSSKKAQEQPQEPKSMRSTVKGWVNTVPPNLRHLSLGVIMPIHYKAIMALPPDLLTLNLPNAYGGRPKDFAALPRSLTVLNVRGAGSRLSSDSVVGFPPNLVALTIGVEHWSELALSQLPSTLTSLEIASNVIPSSIALDLATGKRLPALLTNERPSDETKRVNNALRRNRSTDATGF